MFVHREIPGNSSCPPKNRCQEIRILNRTHRPDAATTQQFRFLKQKLMFSYGLRKFSISKIQAPGPRLHDPGAGDQAPWVQDPKTQCLTPRLQANKSRIYCAGLKFNQNYCSAPHIFPQQIHLKTSESCRGCALPRLPVLDSKIAKPMQLLILLSEELEISSPFLLPRSEQF